MIPSLGPIAALSEMGDGGVTLPEVQEKAIMDTQNEITDHARNTEGRERKTQTFHQMPVVCFCASSAHLEALCMLLMVEKRSIYMHPNVKLHKAQTSAIKAAVRITGWSLPSTWNMVKIADRSSADTTFNVFHSFCSESINSSQLCLNRCNDGETTGATHSRSFGQKSSSCRG